MAEQDTERVTTDTAPDRAAEVAEGGDRRDDRNEETSGSPVPDPAAGDANAEDVPQAD